MTLNSDKMNKRSEQLPADAPDEKIESTASDLEGMNYEPMLLQKVPGFLRMKKTDVQNALEETAALPDGQLSPDLKQKQTDLLLYHYDLLCRLRDDEPEAWDTVNELYEDD